MLLFIIVGVLLCCLYFVMVVAFAVGITRIKTPLESGNNFLSISIIVAMRNEQDNIDNLLKSLTCQDYPTDKYEIVLVNDHSTDKTWNIANDWVKRACNVVLLNLSVGEEGKKHAVAYGVNSAKYDMVTLTDADCVHSKGWLQSISTQFQYSNFDLLIGPVMLAPSIRFIEKMQALEHASLTACSLGACALRVPFMASSANLSFSKSRLGFNVKMLNPNVVSGDDVFLLHNAKRKTNISIGCLFSSNSLVYTKPTNSISSFLQQRARWASKAPGYSDFMAITVGFVVLSFNLLLVSLVALSFWKLVFLEMFVIVFLVKSVADLLLFYPYLKQCQKVSLLNVFLPLQLVYPFYIIVAAVLALFTKVQWKGRR
ncbi:MAG TPA: hypothetical protein DG754_14265 [Bacteroidales bacterium]|nr:hypothetical protein [Bacteroidales bacterium]